MGMEVLLLVDDVHIGQRLSTPNASIVCEAFHPGVEVIEAGNVHSGRALLGDMVYDL